MPSPMHMDPQDPAAGPAEALAAVSPERREDFDLRVARYRDDIVDGLRACYPDHDVEALTTRLLGLAARAYAERDPDLLRLDKERLLAPDWLQQPRMFGYSCYADRFAGGLSGVADQGPYLRDLGVTYLHLMPVLTPRPGDNDGGYAVADYRSVRPDLGTIDDLRALASTLRAQGISLVLDLVLNHVAREHEWARRARAGEERYRGYFHVHADRAVPDAYEETLPEVFPDFAPGNFTWDDDLRAWVWTTFNAWQWDVNWHNPEVLMEYADIVLYLANLGVEVLRLDAIAFTWKRLGTACQNQPEVHALTQVLRAIARIACPAVAFKAEAIVGPRDLVPYLGIGPHTGRVSDLAYHNSLMVQVWSMLATSETWLARQALSNLPSVPTSATWITYVRCHDDIGWAIDDADAAAVGLGGWHHRRFLAQWYEGTFPGSWADGLVFQANEITGDRRTSGTAAALDGLERAEGHGDAHAVDHALGRHFLAHAIVAGWGGIPVVWSGDELGQPNDAAWADEPEHERDNRWAHRPRLDRRRARQRHDLDTVPGRVFSGLAHLARVRAGLPQLHASASSQVLDGTDGGVFATVRRHPSGTLVGLYNVTADWRPVPIDLVRAQGIAHPWDALSARWPSVSEDGLLWLSPYAAHWLIEEEQ